MLRTTRRRGLVVALVLAGGLALVGGVTADTGALPGPLEHDSFYTWPGAQLLQVSTDPWGGGYVRNLPLYYVDCPYACIRPFDTGATVTLTAVPTTGYTFVGWEVANHGSPPDSAACPGTGTCTVTMSQSKDVVAVFSGPPPQPVGSAPRIIRPPTD
jgi:Divergent InlB B-repeat domain